MANPKLLGVPSPKPPKKPKRRLPKMHAYWSTCRIRKAHESYSRWNQLRIPAAQANDKKRGRKREAIKYPDETTTYKRQRNSAERQLTRRLEVTRTKDRQTQKGNQSKDRKYRQSSQAHGNIFRQRLIHKRDCAPAVQSDGKSIKTLDSPS